MFDPIRLTRPRARVFLFLPLIAISWVAPVAAQDCYDSSILKPTPFLGNNGEVFQLADGSLWEVKYEYEYLYEYYPSVIVCPTRGMLVVDGKTLDVELLAVGSGADGGPTAGGAWEVYEETHLAGSISGMVQVGRIFKTTSGNIYEVVGLTLQLVLELQPAVMVLRNGRTYRLIVDGFDEPLICRKLN